MNEDYSKLVEGAQDIRRSLVRGALLASGARFVIAALSALMIPLAIDVLLDLGYVPRLALLTAAGLALLYTIVKHSVLPVVVELRRPLSYYFVQAERRFPELRDVYITAYQVGADLDRERPLFSGPMVRSTIRRAGESVAGLRFSAAFRPWEGIILATTAAIVMGWYAWLVTSHANFVRSRLARLTVGAFREFGEQTASVKIDVSVEESPQVRVKMTRHGALERIAVIRRHDVALVVRLETDATLTPSIRYRPWRDKDDAGPDRPFTSIELSPSNENRYVFKEWDRDAELYVMAGREKTGPIRLRAVEYPSVERVRLRYVFPPYTRVPHQKSIGGDVFGLYGSTVSITVEANKPLRRARFAFPESEISVHGRGRTASTSLQILKPGSYQISLLGEDGFESRSADRRQIRVAYDKPPKIAAKCAPEIYALPDMLENLSFLIEAEDDYGVEKLVVRYETGVLEQAREEVSAEPIRDKLEMALLPPRTLVRGAFPPPFKGLDLQIGQYVDFHFEAWEDHRAPGYVWDGSGRPGPKFASTPTFRLVIVAQEMLGFAFDDAEGQEDWFVFRDGTPGASGAQAGIRRLKDADTKIQEFDRALETSPDVISVDSSVPIEIQSTYFHYLNSIGER